MTDTAEPFDKRRARTRRPCPIWVDKFLRDTMHLQADEVGAYFLILAAMWMRVDCDFPDDNHRLAQVARVSTRLWRSRIGPVIRAFFTTEGGRLISKRLKIEAGLTEDFCEAQSRRNAQRKPEVTHEAPGENFEKSGKPLKNNELASPVDYPTENPGHLPTQHTQHKKDVGGVGGRGREVENRDPPGDPPPADPLPDAAYRLWELVLKAIGLDPAKRLPTRWMPPMAVIEVIRWRGLGISDDEIVAVAKGTRTRHTDPPDGPLALKRAMETYAAAKQAPALSPPQPALTAGGTHGPRPASARAATGAAVHRLADDIAAGTVRLQAAGRDPFPTK